MNGTMTSGASSSDVTGDQRPVVVLHTRGPWKATVGNHEWWIGNDERNVGAVFGDSDHPLNAADAHLMAAAPDLLASLTSIMELMPRSQDRFDLMSIRQWNAARCAIALALGSPVVSEPSNAEVIVP